MGNVASLLVGIRHLGGDSDSQLDMKTSAYEALMISRPYQSDGISLCPSCSVLGPR
jgi:hypothetical protein